MWEIHMKCMQCTVANNTQYENQEYAIIYK